MNDWKIGTRITAGFAALIAITLVLGMFSYSRVATIDRYSTRITNDNLPGLYDIGRLKANSLRNQYLLMEHVMSRGNEAKQRAGSELAQGRALTTQIMDGYEKTITQDKDRELWAALKSARAAYKPEFDEVLRLSEAGKNDEAITYYQSRVRPLYARYMEAVDAAVAFNKDSGDESAKNINEAVGGSKTGILVGITVALIVAIPISLVIKRSMTQPLARAVALIGTIAQGDVSQNVPEDLSARKDEFGELASAMQAMTVSLRRLLGDISGGVQTLASSATELSVVSKQTSAGAASMTEKTYAMSVAAEEASANTLSVASGMEQSSNGLSSVASATEEMSATVGEIAANSAKARAISEQATAQAQTITELMQKLGKAAQEIGKVTETITDISSQTNLLALNATIEAARAGARARGLPWSPTRSRNWRGRRPRPPRTSRRGSPGFRARPARRSATLDRSRR